MAVGASMPREMTRSEWRLEDYTLLKKLYKGNYSAGERRAIYSPQRGASAAACYRKTCNCLYICIHTAACVAAPGCVVLGLLTCALQLWRCGSVHMPWRRICRAAAHLGRRTLTLRLPAFLMTRVWVRMCVPCAYSAQGAVPYLHAAGGCQGVRHCPHDGAGQVQCVCVSATPPIRSIPRFPLAGLADVPSHLPRLFCPPAFPPPPASA